LSLKFSPKIVPISERKLPKAFKIKYLVERSSQNVEKRMLEQDESTNGQILNKHNKIPMQTNMKN
jgi:hypothetical protein